MNQPSLFDALAESRSPARWEQKDICSRHHKGNPESTEAHQRVISSKSAIQAQILEWALKQPYGFTADYATACLGGNPNHIAPRISELLAQGRLVRTAERRKTRSGCWARILKVQP